MTCLLLRKTACWYWASEQYGTSEAADYITAAVVTSPVWHGVVVQARAPGSAPAGIDICHSER